MKRSTFSIKRRSAGPLWARTRQIPFASARFLHEGCKVCVRPLRFFDDLAIAKKLLVMVLFTGLLPLALFFAISLKDTSQTLTAEIQARGEHFASMTAQRIDDYFLARRTDAEILAASDIAVEGLAAHNTFSLTPLQKDALATRFDAFFSIPAEKHGFTDVFLTNQYGEIAYSMNYNPLDLAPLVFDGAFTEAAMAGQTHWTEVFRNSLIDDNLILVATPVYSRSGHVQGTLNIVLNQAKLDAIVTGGLDTHGTSARAYLIDDRGRLLTRLPQSYGLSTLEPLPAAPALDDLVASLQQGADTLATSTRTYRSFDNRSVAGTLSTVHLGDRPTGLVIEVTAKEAYGALSAFQKKASLLVVSLFCLSIPLALVIARSIGKPLQKATATAADLAKYHVHPQGTAPSRRDEIGDLQRAMEAIGVHMVTLIDDLQRTAKALKGASSHLTKGSEKSALSAEEATRALEKISRDSHLQAQDAAHSADQTQKLAEILRSQNTALANLSEATGRVHRVIGDGRSIAHQLVAHHRISQAASQTIADQIAQSHESAEKIQGASALIRAIADQTNLLSLNASIEAARAGKEGAGFAVVAGEIKKLADEAKGSTDEIDRRLRTLQKDTREMKNSLAKLLHASEQQAESVMRTETVFATIEEAMGHSGDRLHALEKTSQAVEESRFAVAQDMAHLSQLTQQTSHRTAGITAAMQQQTATAVEISSASERLDDLATYLDDLIAQFTIEGGRPAKR